MPPSVASLLIVLGSLLTQPEAPRQITIDSLLVLPRVGVSGRSPVYADPVEHTLVTGAWTSPGDGTTVTLPDASTRAWRTLSPGDDGVFRDRVLSGGWALATVEIDADRVMLLEARGHRSVEINGEPRIGDVYDLGTTVVPVLLRAGTNTLLFRTGRGSLRARLVDAPAAAMIEARDATLPDIIRGESEPLVAGVIITNTSGRWLDGLRVSATHSGGGVVYTAVPPIPPLGCHKAAIILPSAGDGETERAELGLTLLGSDGTALGRQGFTLRVRSPHEPHVRTFVSEIDASVQYYAVVPPAPPIAEVPEGAGRPGLMLTLHGAGVEATGQAGAYAAKPGTSIVAPTNRRPYGFDWEDWGRLDAMEVLDLASARFDTDPARTTLTGHSMGGHGTWILGASLAPRFAAIAPSAGWRDFWSYAAPPEPEPDSPVASVLWRAANASRTLLMEANLADLGVYILHGDADDNVPVAQARFMRERLGAFHPDFAYHERPGAGHWWGNQCVDWGPLIEFLLRHRRPEPGARGTIDFTTVDPGISATSGWITIEAQTVAREPSRVVARDTDPGEPIQITTSNVSRLSVQRPALRGDAAPALTIDGQTLQTTEALTRLSRDADGVWTPASIPDPSWKNPARNGAFKDAFNHRVLLVVGTVGTAQENAWALAKARYDADAFWYRGNGALQVVTDAQFLASMADPDARGALLDRSVILYGNCDTNGAWDHLLRDSPISVGRAGIRVGERVIEGEDLACLFIRPRPDSTIASVGVVGGTGIPGLRLTNHLPYFVSGAHYPDWTILDASMLTDPAGGRGGVVGCGFFALDWTLGPDHAWRE